MSAINNAKAYDSDLAIECAKVRKCGWKGMESDLTSRPHKSIKGATQKICPWCGCDSYYRCESALASAISGAGEGSEL